MVLGLIGVICVLYTAIPVEAVMIVMFISLICEVWFLILMASKPFIYRNRWDPVDDGM